MAHIKREDVINLSKLSCIDCNGKEIDSILQDLQNVLSYIDLLHEVDTSGVTPCNHVLADVHTALRDDVVGISIPRKEFLDNSPAHIGGMIKVPLVIKQQ